MGLFGKYAPAGSEITCNPWFVARDKTLYGNNTEDFRPERWLEDSEEKVKDYNKYSMVFGNGARVYLGKDIVLMEMAKGPLLVGVSAQFEALCADLLNSMQFFQYFEPQLVNPMKTGEFIVHGGVGFWERINITLIRRKLMKCDT
jgi:hypothetical protein